MEGAAIPEPLRATLRFLAKMTLRPQELNADDARAVLASGISREALAQAIHVAYLFNIYDRLADSLGWEVPALDSGAYEAGARNLLERGYL